MIDMSLTTTMAQQPQQPLLTTTTTTGWDLRYWVEQQAGTMNDRAQVSFLFIFSLYLVSIYLTFLFVFGYFTCDDDDEQHKGHNQDEQKSAQDAFFFSQVSFQWQQQLPTPHGHHLQQMRGPRDVHDVSLALGMLF